MNKMALFAGIAVLILIATYVIFGGNEAQAPIVDPVCPEGYALVGEGCMPLKDACENRGDNYFFDELAKECRKR